MFLAPSLRYSSRGGLCFSGKGLHLLYGALFLTVQRMFSLACIQHISSDTKALVDYSQVGRLYTLEVMSDSKLRSSPKR